MICQECLLASHNGHKMASAQPMLIESARRKAKARVRQLRKDHTAKLSANIKTLQEIKAAKNKNIIEAADSMIEKLLAVKQQ